MKIQIYLGLYILCDILSQGISSVSDANNSDSLDDYIRKKRLIDRSQNRNIPVQTPHIPYIVQILLNDVHICGGIILFAQVIITLAFCVHTNPSPAIRYNVLSGSHLRHVGTRHNVTKIRRYPTFNNISHDGDIALLKIFPPINLTLPNVDNIGIYTSFNPVPLNTLVKVSGWGSITVQRKYAKELRSITVFTCQCIHEYPNIVDSVNKFICTIHPWGLQYAGIGDGGDPLVFNNSLIGILTEYEQNGTPDVFINLAYFEYKAWITATLRTFL